jgi:hypothetical protein
LVVLIFLTLVNTLPTKHWLASLFVVAGQVLLLSDYLPFPVVTGDWTTPVGLLLFAAASVAFALNPPRRSAATSLDHLWLDFRDTFGLFWSLRVQERLLAAAKIAQWSVLPTWFGWVHLDGSPLKDELPAEQQKAIMVTYRGLLRRFVSNEWVNARLPAPEQQSATT